MAGISSFRSSSKTLPAKHGTPTLDELEELGAEIAEKWIKLGRRLGVSDAELQGINQCHYQLDEKGYHMLKHWRQKKGSAATYQALCDGLNHKLVQRQDLADKFCHVDANANGDTASPSSSDYTEADSDRKGDAATGPRANANRDTASPSSSVYTEANSDRKRDSATGPRGQYGRNLLHNASKGGNVAIIETMLSRGLDIDSKDSDGDTPLMIAAFSGKMEAVNYLLLNEADPSLKGKYRRNLLHNASKGGNVAIIETMLSRGLDIDSKDRNGDTPLMIAVGRGKAEAVEYLLSRGAF